jgi:hypothetical protein
LNTAQGSRADVRSDPSPSTSKAAATFSQTRLTFVAVGDDAVHRSDGTNEEEDPEGKG